MITFYDARKYGTRGQKPRKGYLCTINYAKVRKFYITL